MVEDSSIGHKEDIIIGRLHEVAKWPKNTWPLGAARGALLGAPLQGAVDAHEEIFVVEGLDDVVLDPLQLEEVLHPVAGGEHDDGQLPPADPRVDLPETGVA